MKPSRPNATAFVFIDASTGQEARVRHALSGLDGVLDIHPIFGEYDLLCKVEARDYHALAQVIADQIRTVPGIVASRTLTARQPQATPA